MQPELKDAPAPSQASSPLPERVPGTPPHPPETERTDSPNPALRAARNAPEVLIAWLDESGQVWRYSFQELKPTRLIGKCRIRGFEGGRFACLTYAGWNWIAHPHWGPRETHRVDGKQIKGAFVPFKRDRLIQPTPTTQPNGGQ